MCLRGELVFLRAELDANGMSTNVMKLGVETEAKIYIYTQMHAHSLCIDMCTHLSIYPTLYLSSHQPAEYININCSSAFC